MSLLTNANFRKIFENYAANIQSISVATKTPIFEFKDKKLQDYWNIFSFKNNFTKIFQRLTQEIFKNGIYGIGLEITKNNIPKIILGEIIDFKYDDFNLIKLTIDLKQDFKENNLTYVVFEQWDLTNEKNIFVTKKIVEKSFLNNEILKQRKEKIVNSNKVNRYDFIPWIIFSNKWDDKKDLELDLNFIFESLNNDFELLMRDGLISRSLIFQNEKILNTNINNIILDPKEVIIKTNRLQTFLASPDMGMLIKQGNPQAIILLQKLKEQIAWIEKFAILKMNSSAFGTKNLQTAEVENLNSNFNDLIESKANLYEFQLFHFVELWIQFCNNHNLFNFLSLKPDEVNICVFGSTKWLLTEAKKYQFNQDGANLNPTNNLESINNES